VPAQSLGFWGEAPALSRGTPEVRRALGAGVRVRTARIAHPALRRYTQRCHYFDMDRVARHSEALGKGGRMIRSFDGLLRISINLGDIIVEPDGDIYGDGVSAALRTPAPRRAHPHRYQDKLASESRAHTAAL
jgi:hypothetical protein